MLFLDGDENGIYFAYDFTDRGTLRKGIPSCVYKHMRYCRAYKKDRLNAHSALNSENLD